MIDKDKLLNLKKLIDKSQRIVIIVPNNIDGDSLGSASALEEIFNKLNKEAVVYCAIEVPESLRYVKGWEKNCC